MIRAFEYLTNLAVRCPLPNPLPRGEGIKLSNPNIFRFICHLIFNPTFSDFQQPNPLSPWERVRERASKLQACLFGKRYGPVRPINPYPKASSCRIKPNHE